MTAGRPFHDPDWTATGEPRAQVPFDRFKTLWINTGTLCNIACTNCYIESSPKNDALVYVTAAEIAPYLDAVAVLAPGPIEIGFTGGEPFLNPDIIDLIGDALARGHKALVLTNAMRPMMRPRVQEGLERLRARHADRLTLRVSLDHWAAGPHDEERGAGAFAEACEGIDWLAARGFRLALAGRAGFTGPEDPDPHTGYANLIATRGWPIDPHDPEHLVVFPEMDGHTEVPEITSACWSILDKDPRAIMCASSRMIVKRRGAQAPDVVACTLLPYDPAFSLGADLPRALEPIKLKHRYCAQFCVLGGASCSA